jgi:hypothetical protein
MIFDCRSSSGKKHPSLSRHSKPWTSQVIMFIQPEGGCFPVIFDRTKFILNHKMQRGSQSFNPAQSFSRISQLRRTTVSTRTRPPDLWYDPPDQEDFTPEIVAAA